MRCTVLVLLSVLIFPVLAYSSDEKQPPTVGKRPAATWSSDDRIRARFDPVLMRDRRERVAKSMRKAPPDAYVIDGKNEPEAFFAWELMDGFLQSLDVPPSRLREARSFYTSAIEERGWDFDTFWREVDAATAVYVATRKELAEHRVQLARERKTQGVPVNGGISPYLTDELCYERAEAIERLRQTFGEAIFDDFLYRAVAPTMTLWLTPRRDAAVLKKMERGCR